VRRRGRFAFRLDSVTAIRRTALSSQGLLKSPDWLFWAARSRFVNSRREAWQALTFATSGTPMDAYAQWHARFARQIDLDGLDRPHSDWRAGPVFHLILNLSGSDPARLGETIRSLRAQVYPRWSLCAVTDATTSAASLSVFRAEAAGDARLSETALDLIQLNSPANQFDQNDYVALIDSGDCLAEHALAVVAETLARDPELELIYSDEDRATPEGTLHSPSFKPDWSPHFHKHLGYVGRLTLFRSPLITANGFYQLLVDEERAIGELAKDIQRSAILHIRRVLYCRQAPTTGDKLRAKVRASFEIDDPPPWPDVAVLIPTRDRAKLLAECISGLKDTTDYPSFETIVVDNGSTAPDAISLLEKLAAAPRTQVLLRPGPFNFSALSNDAARATKARVLLFLNNDIVMLERSWLKAMVRWAIKPGIGVVGAKLLFPNGRIQHAGVVLGFGGIAGHIYRRLPKDHRGYLAQLTVPREMTAVTGACIAIERSKFEAVGGFDAENLPVDLNDIDLCLRVDERGWTNIWTPEATLIHHQSGTRGIDSDPFALYRKERTYFVQRWSEVIRDDPYFHPGLSLYAHDVALA